MTHRIDLQMRDQVTTILFQGVLDQPALSELEKHCRVQGRAGVAVRVLLVKGTKVEAGLLEELARIDGITLAAESPFLSRWIQSCLPPGAASR